MAVCLTTTIGTVIALHSSCQNPAALEGLDVRCIPISIGVPSPNWGLDTHCITSTTSDDTLCRHAEGLDRSQNAAGTSPSCSMSYRLAGGLTASTLRRTKEKDFVDQPKKLNPLVRTIPSCVDGSNLCSNDNPIFSAYAVKLSITLAVYLSGRTPAFT